MNTSILHGFALSTICSDVAEYQDQERLLLGIRYLTGASFRRIRDVLATKPYSLADLHALVASGDTLLREELCR